MIDGIFLYLYYYNHNGMNQFMTPLNAPDRAILTVFIATIVMWKGILCEDVTLLVTSYWRLYHHCKIKPQERIKYKWM